MELTFKGKSLEFNDFYAKTENNIDINISEYGSLVNMLKSIGYLGYTIVDKKRFTYSSDNIECLMFDLDGTLINSENAFYNSFKDVLKKYYNIDISISDYVENELNKDTMLLKKSKVDKLLNENETEKDIMNKIYDDYSNKFEKLITSVDSIITFELLKKIKEKGIKLALITTSKKQFINFLEENLKVSEIFDCIITRDDVENLKPSNEAYLKAIKKLNVNTDNCIAFEDSKKGIDSASSANINAVQINGYNFNKYELENVFSIDYIQRVLLILLNYIK